MLWCHGKSYRLHSILGNHSLALETKISIGEMATLLPIPGGHVKLAERFVDPALSFTLGWFYWYNWTIGLPAELSALAVLMQFWKTVRIFFSCDNPIANEIQPDEVSPAVWITMGITVVLVINSLGVGEKHLH